MLHPATAGIRIDAVDWLDPRAVALREVMAAEISRRYARDEPEDPAISAARDAALAVDPDRLVVTLLAVDEATGEPLGHIALRMLGDEWEAKRLIVLESARGRGAGRGLMLAVLEHSRAGGATRMILQTGAAQPESIALYGRLGFTRIPVYEPYVATMPDSLCFEYRFDGAPE